MKKILLFFGILPLYAAVNLWDEETIYRFENTTDEIMDVTWQSGGGKADTLSGRKGTFTLGPLNSHDIRTTGADCIDQATITGATTGQKVLLHNICKQKIKVMYEGVLPHQQLRALPS